MSCRIEFTPSAAQIFEPELAAWSTDEKRRPKARTLELFRGWFDAAGRSVVADLASDPIKKERL